MTRVKVCGITDEAALETAADAGADAIGVICDVPVDTHREVASDRAAELVAAAPPFVTTVLVTMPTDPAEAIELVDAVGPDAVQIHGTLEPDELASVREAIDASLLVALDADDADAATAGRYDAVADGLLVDTPGEGGGGGTGETHDWNRTRTATADLESPLILAGGLTPENVVDAVRTVDPSAVDVASGVEGREGGKDADAVQTFVERAKNASTPALQS
ncbi:phosphoribosylanthranilate isomerase [Natronococcus wangiae]|uniref:phosphoribosylanthranilate isomerase n=1 Tax=Natronococcus wangiae TaxID=3068275 RepID=UPI00273F7497|nr:phosphoribosylanthranilate isomerase [Natronococcus sp. AD5]